MELTFNDLTRAGNPYADKFHIMLKENGANFATGVPCGVLRYFIANFIQDKEFINIIGQNEPEAVGIASGAYLGGKTPVLYMQNSGMLKSTNEFGSLLLPYKIPVLCITTYRGCPGEDAPQHIINGKITKPTLQLMEVYYNELEKNNIEQCVSEAYKYIQEENKPAVILVKRGWTSRKTQKDTNDVKHIRIEQKYEINTKELFKNINDMRHSITAVSRDEALDSIIEATTQEDAIFSSTGLMSRSLYERHDRPNQFYNTGGFGLVSSLGLGFAVTNKKTRTIIIDGDSSLLTNFGTLVTIGSNKPENLIHIVLDNGAYASCSEEKSCSDKANLPLVAALQGYTDIYLVDSAKNLKEAIEIAKTLQGPSFIHTKIRLGGRRDFKRPKDLPYIAKRFKEHFSSKNQ